MNFSFFKNGTGWENKVGSGTDCVGEEYKENKYHIKQSELVL